MISRLNVKSVFSFIRSCQTVFQESYIIFHSHQQCMRIPVIPRLCQRFVLSVFQILVILINVQWYFIVILVCGSPVMYDFEHLIMIFFCHLYIFFVEIQVFCPFLNRAVRFKSSLCILDNSPFSDVPFGNIFSHSVDCNLFS